jgi:putative transferase (TIGR04331 family)
MKSNFVVSGHRDIWITSIRKLFAVDFYIRHVLEREGCLSDYEEIEVAPASRSTPDDFIYDHEFVDRKFHQYQDLLAVRLDELHNTSYGKNFWQKAMSLGVLRHTTFCYDLFKVCESHLNVTLHDCRILNQDSFIIPEDFDAHRQLFQHTDLGQEQLFSVYCGLFHPGQFVSWKGITQPPTRSAELPKSGWRGLFERLIPSRIVRALVVIIDNPGRLVNEFVSLLLRIRSPQVGIIGCNFSPEHRHRLAVESAGRIQTIPLPKMPILISAPRWNMRDQLLREDPSFDRFDKFVFACLKHGMPKIFIEDFSDTYAHINQHFNRYPDLRWGVCEYWIGHTLSSLSMAVLSQRDVKHIYNEHNYLSYFFVGNNLKYLAPLADEFVTLGWGDSSIPNLVRGASLFQWITNKRSHIKDIDILFICGLPMARAPEINASYGDSGAYRALEYFDMNERFFAGLGEETLRTVYCRGYPSSVVRGWAIWDFTFMLEKYIIQLRKYDDSAISAKLLMQRSKLVVSNYLSTSYLEAIVSNVPSVFLWNRATNMFIGKYAEAFDALIGSGICQTDPEEAAKFINKIKGDPGKWWRSPVVQKSRQMFLDANIGNPETMIQHLLTKAEH